MLEWRAFQVVFFLLILLQGLVAYGLFQPTFAKATVAKPVLGQLVVNPVLHVPVNPPNPFI